MFFTDAFNQRIIAIFKYCYWLHIKWSSEMSQSNEFKAKIFKALGEPVRLEIIEFLRDGEKSVLEMTEHLKVIQPVVSRHLKILKACGLVKDRKEGNQRFYSITNPETFKVIGTITPELVEILFRRKVEQIA